MVQTVHAIFSASPSHSTMKQRKKQAKRKARERSLRANLKPRRASTIEERRFAHALTRFLAQECVRGAQYSIADEQLFPRFRAFWKQVSEEFEHPALLGQFRVELAQRGFQAIPGEKKPLWVGLTLRDQDHRHRYRRKASKHLQQT